MDYSGKNERNRDRHLFFDRNKPQEPVMADFTESK